MTVSSVSCLMSLFMSVTHNLSASYYVPPMLVVFCFPLQLYSCLAFYKLELIWVEMMLLINYAFYSHFQKILWLW
jgi:hypothetical protein